MALSIGTPAPDFTLKSKADDGLVDFTLSKNFGKKNTLILFFPLAFTGVCTAEMCDVSGGLSGYTDLACDVVAISVDSPFAQEAWAKMHHITLPIASDLNKKTAKAYGVLLKDLGGLGSVSARAAFLVDKKGVIRYAEQMPTPKELPDFDAIKAALAKLTRPKKAAAAKAPAKKVPAKKAK